MKFDELLNQAQKQAFDEPSDSISRYTAAASILFDLKKQESETNSNYALALIEISNILGDDMPEDYIEMFNEIMQDENDHAAKFNHMANKLMGYDDGSIED